MPFDFSTYDPKNPWHFPPERLVHFAREVSGIFRKSRDTYVRKKPYPDLRYVVFHELFGACHTLNIFSILLREQGSKLAWWKELDDFEVDFDKRLVQSLNMSLRDFLKYGFFHVLAQQVEDALVQVYQKVDQTHQEKGLSYWGICRELFEITELYEWAGLPELLWATRNSLQNNGKYCPPSGNDMLIKYKGVEYPFLADKEADVLSWGFIDGWDFIQFQAKEADAMLNSLFESPLVSTIPSIRTRWLD